jgi:hypothetical protein
MTPPPPIEGLLCCWAGPAGTELGRTEVGREECGGKADNVAPWADTGTPMASIWLLEEFAEPAGVLAGDMALMDALVGRVEATEEDMGIADISPGETAPIMGLVTVTPSEALIDTIRPGVVALLNCSASPETEGSGISTVSGGSSRARPKVADGRDGCAMLVMQTLYRQWHWVVAESH